MAFHSIDQALTVMLTGLIYGSGAWLACTFGFYVVTQQRKAKATRPVFLLAPAAELSVAETFRVRDSLSEDRLPIETFVEDKEPSIEPSIEHAIEQPCVSVAAAAAERSVVDVVKISVERETDCATGQRFVSSIEIVCEPVDWKKWRVADLRKASVAGACGVRTRAVGSRRNLLKADLIVQYKQQLKRLTKSTSKLLYEKEIVA